MKPVVLFAAVVSYWLAAAIAWVVIDLLGGSTGTLPMVVGSIVGCQAAVALHARQAGAVSSFGVKMVLGVTLGVASLAFGGFVHLAVAPYPYPDVTLPIAMMGGFGFPFVLFNPLWKALSAQRAAAAVRGDGK